MNFVQATNRLMRGVTLGDLAEELGVSTVLLSRARSDASHPQHRSPPRGWEAAVVKLARQRADELAQFVERMASAEKKPVKTTTRRTGKGIRRRRASSKRR